MTGPDATIARECLMRGGPFSDFPRHDGRVDLRDMALSSLRIGRTTRMGPCLVGDLSGRFELRRARLRDIDFSGSSFRHAWVYEQSAFTNCRFDGADCRRLVLGTTTFTDCTFVRTDLRESALGRVLYSGLCNSFVGCTFSRARMSNLWLEAARFEGCSFDRCDLDSTDFGQSSFIDCRFIGRVEGVMFWRRDPRLESLRETCGPVPDAEYRNLDLSQSVFSGEFRNLDRLQGIYWPKDPDLMILGDYARALEEVLEFLKTCPARHEGPRFYFEQLRKTAGTFGILHRRDVEGLRDSLGDLAMEEVMDVLRPYEQPAHRDPEP